MGIFDIVYYKSEHVYFRINKITDKSYNVRCTLNMNMADTQFMAHVDIVKDIITIGESSFGIKKIPDSHIQYIIKHLSHKTNYVIIDRHNYDGCYGICPLPTESIQKGELDSMIRRYIYMKNDRISIIHNILKNRKNGFHTGIHAIPKEILEMIFYWVRQ